MMHRYSKDAATPRGDIHAAAHLVMRTRPPHVIGAMQ